MHKSISCSWLLRREGFICVGLVMCVCVCARVFSSMTIWKLPQMRDRIRPLLYGRFVLNLSLLGGPFPTPLSPVSHQQTTYLKLWKGKVKNQDDSLRKWNKPREKKKKKATGPLHRLVLVHWNLGKSTLYLQVNLVNILTMEGKR